MIDTVTTECVYKIDVVQKQFCYIKPDNLFLCNFSVKDAMRAGYDFRHKIVYPDDLLLWENMYTDILQHLKEKGEPCNTIDYFFCTFRLQRMYSIRQHPLPQMIYHRLTPVWEDNELRYFICNIGSSTRKKSGNLCVHYKDGLTYEEYNFTTKGWERKMKKKLTEPERAILMLASQGKNTKEIADILCKSPYTISNWIKRIFSKLGVHSMPEAIEIAVFHRMIYTSEQAIPEFDQLLVETPYKRIRVLLTDGVKQRIQQHLNDGKSIRQTAKQEGVSEGSIRYWKKKMKFTTTPEK
jgi:DNA-binding CsgD family transcriptional regulator